MTNRAAIAISQFKKIGQILVERGDITQADLDKALQISSTKRVRLGTYLVAEGFITDAQFAQAMAEQYELEYLPLEVKNLDPEVLKLIPTKLARQHMVAPIGFEDEILVLATHDPISAPAIEAVRQAVTVDFQFKVSPESQLRALIAKNYPSKETSVEEFAKQVSREVGKEREETLKIRGEPVIKPIELSAADNTISMERLVKQIIDDAIRRHASDIHIEPTGSNVRVRLRVYGVLQEAAGLPKDLHSLLLARLKVLATLDIAEKRKSQDGSFQFRSGDTSVDIRLSTLPTIQGEKAVMRILDKSMLKTNLNQLGMGEAMVAQLKTITARPHGLILVTGPTGSGKTTTVYSLMTYLNTVEKNVISVEDPIEYQVEGINQVQVNVKSGTNFPSALRGILRQDPDILIIGEIRDLETAEIAIRASLTGHLVVSTLHTNDALSTVVRLIDMGVEPFLIASSLIGVVGQRLVRVLCPECKRTGPAAGDELLQLNADASSDLSQVAHSAGCEHCNQLGFRGREAIFELLCPSLAMKRAIADKKSEHELFAIIEAEGFQNMRQHGIEKIRQFVTTIGEVLRQTS